MPKLKTRKAAAKRFKITATGKIMHGHQMARHLRRKKSSSNLRRKAIQTELTGKFIKKIRQMIVT